MTKTLHRKFQGRGASQGREEPQGMGGRAVSHQPTLYGKSLNIFCNRTLCILEIMNNFVCYLQILSSFKIEGNQTSRWAKLLLINNGYQIKLNQVSFLKKGSHTVSQVSLGQKQVLAHCRLWCNQSINTDCV